MADVVIDVSGGGATTLMTGLKAVRTGGTIVVASGAAAGASNDALDLGLIRKKRVTLRGVRGHSYAAVERALQVIAAGGAGLDLLSSAPRGLDMMEDALAAVAGTVDDNALHVSVDPWL
jgi:threonine dehydrogenase-like Zn-dependent dehydrogenase